MVLEDLNGFYVNMYFQDKSNRIEDCKLCTDYLITGTFKVCRSYDVPSNHGELPHAQVMCEHTS